MEYSTFTSAEQGARPSERPDVFANWSHPQRKSRKFILCFDGTGNKFSGTDADSNILKIYRMLDRSDESQFHYYQPGIGTYVTTKSLSHTSGIDRLKSAYLKAKDSAVGSSFSDHVMGGYKFLMRYYMPGDDIYLFGFSRGAYTARFLAEMLDHVGLLSAGNEEMCRFAWKTFSKWQMRQERNEKEKREKKELLDFMMAFRETFSRPVRRIKFLGLFDTVNSVPRFENAWMQRSKFPYTARSSARVIRHAVAIDERRAKFRQDLISETRPGKGRHGRHHIRHNKHHPQVEDEKDRGRSGPNLNVPERYRDHSETAGIRSRSPGLSVRSCASSISNFSLTDIRNDHHDESEGENEQDIQEVWFAGCHADIGGGWPLNPGEDTALSHIPLSWMVREAQRAGLNFDQVKLRDLNCIEDGVFKRRRPSDWSIPHIEIDPATPTPSQANSASSLDIPFDEADKADEKDELFQPYRSRFHASLHAAATKGRIHDVLQFHNGAPKRSVISWNIMEYLPFRRMDLQEDGSWVSIAWPLPKGETRDIPENATIHSSVIRRMEADPEYRPGNLIVGGGGRGVRKAPKEMGMGNWIVKAEPGDPLGEVVVRAEKPVRKSTGSRSPILDALRRPKSRESVKPMRKV
ncbi:hypothetical protein GQ43DRAFT_473118 [Delitschia confertaspora ATCC 74209]|uniref:T6SS Phospholipase effector Tle1-like catalytic domain-containing protein n=1 Tax=Delitschia confertaspora ATCC 74209 TaxID=1513339 RepID=A0A9P4JP36_9PLEO|nr:hypothetical protein GQ43DRAFT_473118 [Delitschia confertaspora ATCC 74209]